MAQNRQVTTHQFQMKKRMRTPMKRLFCIAILGILVLSACGSPSAERGGNEDAKGNSADTQQILESYGLAGKSADEVINALDRLPVDQRPTDLMASVRADELILSAGDSEGSVPLDRDRFYLSAAPFISQTHECFFHSLTTCKGELADTEVRVKIVDKTNDTVIVDEDVETYSNGFVGFWLPADIEGTMSIRLGDKTGTVDFTTKPDAPTCVTTLKLV